MVPQKKDWSKLGRLIQVVTSTPTRIFPLDELGVEEDGGLFYKTKNTFM